jgi:hypothetical protein
MREITSDDAVRIRKRLLGEAETDTVLPLVLRILVEIPFEAGRHDRRLTLVWRNSHTPIWKIECLRSGPSVFAGRLQRFVGRRRHQGLSLLERHNIAGFCGRSDIARFAQRRRRYVPMLAAIGDDRNRFLVVSVTTPKMSGRPSG